MHRTRGKGKRNYRANIDGLQLHLTWLLVLAFCSCLVPRYGHAFEMMLEGSVGYDSNPALSPDAEGSGFSAYGLQLGHQVDSLAPILVDLSVEGVYQQYWQTEDNYRLAGGAAVTYPLAGGRVLPSLFGRAQAYRDHLIEADERNAFVLGVKADWMANRWASLDLEIHFRWNRFLNPSKPFSGKGQGRTSPEGKGRGGSHQNSLWRYTDRGSPNGGSVVPAAGPGGGSGQNKDNPLATVYPPRHEFLWFNGARLNFFPFSQLTVTVHGAYADSSSSLDMESYRETEAGVVLLWDLAASWRLEADVAWFRRWYDRVPESITAIRRVNDTYAGTIQLRRFWGEWEVFGLWEWKNGQSPYHYTSYGQMGFQCGLSWLF